MSSRFEHPVGLRDERLADVEAREVLALEELDVVALLGEERGTVLPAGPPPMTTTSDCVGMDTCGLPYLWYPSEPEA